MKLGNSSAFYPVEPREVGEGHECLVIAEFGLNHNGSRARALEMVNQAAAAGCKAIKIQAYATEEFCDPEGTYTYFQQGKRSNPEEVTERQFDLFKRCEFGMEDFQAIRDRCRALGLYWIATATDRYWARRMAMMAVDALKVGSDDITHLPLLRELRALDVPVILSTGMANGAEIRAAVQESKAQAVLHCVSRYPTPPSKANLGRMETLKRMVRGECLGNAAIGFSDHTEGITAALVAIGLGAHIVEKHFTLDRSLPGPDHRFSMTPNDLKLICDFAAFRHTVTRPADLEPSPEEADMAKLARRSIVAARDLPAGHLVTEDDLAYRRPGTGIPPSNRWLVAGLVTSVAVAAGAQLGPRNLRVERQRYAN